MLIDTHAHLDAEPFKDDLDALLIRAKEAGITKILTVGAGYGGFSSAYNALAIAEKYPWIYPSVGIHPSDSNTPLEHQKLEILAANPRVVAIGETGLDLYWKDIPLPEQYPWFEAQVEIAKKLNKPLIIHSRIATKECLEVLTRLNARDVGGVFHCYTDSPDFVSGILDINFHLSYTGVVTFKKSADIQEAVRRTPLDRLMVETDAPFLAPEPHRGKRCESAFVVHTARKVAELKGIEFDELCEITTANAEKLFQLS